MGSAGLLPALSDIRSEEWPVHPTLVGRQWRIVVDYRVVGLGSHGSETACGYGRIRCMNDPMTLRCPVCGALPGAPCVRISGTLLPGPHSKRKELALGLKMASRSEANQQSYPQGLTHRDSFVTPSSHQFHLRYLHSRAQWLSVPRFLISRSEMPCFSDNSRFARQIWSRLQRYPITTRTSCGELHDGLRP